jgi:hypothetical protein
VWLYSTQVYEFELEQIAPNVFAPGEHALVSIGPERNDLDALWDRSPAAAASSSARSQSPGTFGAPRLASRRIGMRAQSW